MIKLWKLGNSELNIAPTKEAFNKFRKIVEDDAVTNIIWDDNVNCQLICENGVNVYSEEIAQYLRDKLKLSILESRNIALTICNLLKGNKCGQTN